MGRKAKDGKLTTFKLSHPHRWLLAQLGDGDMTAGLELVAQLTRLLALAQSELDGSGSPVSQAIADEISELEIPEIYEAAKAVEVRNADGEVSAWIV